MQLMYLHSHSQQRQRTRGIELLGSYAPTWIKADPGSTSLGSTKLLIKSV